jgi:hypothetical protein
VKTIGFNSATIALTLLASVACAPAEQTLDKRGAKLSALESVGNGNAVPNTDDPSKMVPTPGDMEPVPVVDPGEPSADPVKDPGTVSPVVVEPTVAAVAYSPLKLVAAKGLESIKLDDIILTSKVSATEFVLFGKGGKSWSYKPEATVATDVLKSIDAVVIPPPGSTLYSLPDSQFWFIAQDKLGRYKPSATGAAAGEKSISVEQFLTKTFQGDLSKMKVLYVSLDEIIFHLDTHIAILSAKTTPAVIKQFPIAKLPVDLSGVVQAGRRDGGYWFRANGSLFLLNSGEEIAGTSPWSKGVFTVDPGDLSGLAMWTDATGTKYAGSSLGRSAAGLFKTEATAAPAK